MTSGMGRIDRGVMKRIAKLTVAAGVVPLLAACSGGQPAAPQTMPAPESPAVTPSATPTATAAPQKLPTGGTYQGIQVDAAVLEVKKEVKADYREGTQIAALVRVCSKADAELSVSTFPWVLLDNDDGRYNASSYVAGTGLEPAFAEGERLQKRDCVRGWMVWDTPKTPAAAIRYRPDSEPGGTWTL